MGKSIGLQDIAQESFSVLNFPENANLSAYFYIRTKRADILAFYGESKLLAKKGEKYECEECGLVAVIKAPCGCKEAELICCEAPMKPSKAKAKPKTKKK